jgi:hypothetical protein
METRLRILARHLAPVAGRRYGSPALFWGVVSAIMLQLIFSANVLAVLGISVGNIHPATFILVICAVCSLAQGVVPLSRRFRETPSLMLFVLGIPLLTLYSIYFAGFNGSTVFIETFWSAGLLALVLEPTTAKQKRRLATILIALVLVNVLVGLQESLTHTELFPINYEGADASFPAATEIVDDFRAHAFYSHPLSASLVTSMAFFLLYTMRLRLVLAAPIFCTMLVGLLAFGGRTALVVTSLVSVATALYLLLTGILKRNLSPGFALSILTAAVAVPIILVVIVTQTTIADRIVDTFYYDGSAEVRMTQWEIFNRISLSNWLFGISKQDLAVLKFQIGLGGRDTDIENFWILIFLDLGLIGFSVFMTIFLGFVVHMARRTGSMYGWLLVGSAMVIDSTSNSLGVWSNDLMLEVAFLIAMAGFRDFVPRRVMRMERLVSMVRQESFASNGLHLLPTRMRAPNLRIP